MNDTLIVIPARYGSTRLPGKMLEKIQDKSILQWVYEACKKANCGDVVIATENKIVVKAAQTFGANAIMTSDQCKSGTDRVYEASKKFNADYIVNVQGDEPFIAPQTIKNVVKKLKTDKEADIVTACAPTLDVMSISNPSHVKAVLGKDGRALYFSRSVIPYKRHDGEAALKAPYYLHSGIYAFKKDALKKFVNLPTSILEDLEKLEQLRALEAGMAIKSVIINTSGPAIDTPADLYAARKYAENIK